MSGAAESLSLGLARLMRGLPVSRATGMTWSGT